MTETPSTPGGRVELVNGCPVCGAPAFVSDEGETLHGVDFDGSDSVFAVVRLSCAAGHRFMAIDDEKTVHYPR